MAFAQDWATHVQEAARRGADPLASWDVAVDIGGNTLGGADAGLVGKYWAIVGNQRNEEWISSNPTEFWQRQLRDAQNHFANEMQHYGNLRSDIMMKEARAKEAALDKWKQEMETKVGADTQAVAQRYNELSSQLQQQYAEQQNQMQSLMQQSAQQAQIQEQQRAAAEARATEQRQQDRWSTFLGDYGLTNVDADKYAGEQSQAAGYKSFLESQLGSAGFDAGSLLSGYDPTEAINAARRTTEGFDTYKQSLQPWANQYGVSNDLMTNAMGVQSEAQQGLNTYDLQVRDKLSQLGQAYQAYSQLGDIRQTGGDVMSLLGYNRPDEQGLRQTFTGIGSEYDRISKETEMLYGGDTAKPQGLYQQSRQQWSGLESRFNPALSGLLSTFGSAQGALQGMYGNVSDVASGRFTSEAARYGGLLSAGSGQVSSVLGEAQQAGTRAQQTYNETANRLRTQRISEGVALREQQAQSDFLERQNRLLGLAATTLQKPMERTQSVLRRVRPEETQYSQDPLGLTRGYSSLLGG